MIGIKALGGKELRKYLGGEKLIHKQAILAKCYECMNGYVDGKADCKIPGYPLYPLMPYRNTPLYSPNVEKVAPVGKNYE